ncbi:hypothetical protein RYX36_028274, partial [Vicia faba]
MADPQPLLLNSEPTQLRLPRVASVDVFRGLSVFLMIFVDYGGSIFPVISHVPWNGIHLADLVMPFFLFLVGISLALLYKVNCSVRGDLGPACNSAGMIDRYILGLDHLYKKPVYRNLK